MRASFNYGGPSFCKRNSPLFRLLFSFQFRAPLANIQHNLLSDSVLTTTSTPTHHSRRPAWVVQPSDLHLTAQISVNAPSPKTLSNSGTPVDCLLHPSAASPPHPLRRWQPLQQSSGQSVLTTHHDATELSVVCSEQISPFSPFSDRQTKLRRRRLRRRRRSDDRSY